MSDSEARTSLGSNYPNSRTPSICDERRAGKEEKEGGKVLAFGKVVERPTSKKRETRAASEGGGGANGSANSGNGGGQEGEGNGGGDGNNNSSGGGAPGAVKIDTNTANDEVDLTEKLRARMFPRIYDSKSDTFVFHGCNFKVAKSKAKTMRVVMYDEFDIACSYTLEASFSGLNGYHFCMNDLRKMGEDFCESLVAFGDYLEIENVATTKGVRTTRGGGEEVRRGESQKSARSKSRQGGAKKARRGYII